MAKKSVKERGGVFGILGSALRSGFSDEARRQRARKFEAGQKRARAKDPARGITGFVGGKQPAPKPPVLGPPAPRGIVAPRPATSAPIAPAVPPADDLTAFAAPGENAAAPGVSQDFAASVRRHFPAAMAGIEDKFRRSFEDIARREQAGRAALDLLPDRLKAQYAAGAQALTSQTGELGSALQGAGLGGAAAETLGGGLAPFQGALSALQTERLADQPLLQQGVDQYFGGQRAALEGARAQEGIEEQRHQQELEAKFAMQKAGSATKLTPEQESQNEIAHLQRLEKAGFPQGKQPQLPKGVKRTSFGRLEMGQERGFTLEATNPTKAASIRKAPYYSRIAREIDKMASGKKAMTPEQVVAELSKKFKNKPQAISLALFDYLGPPAE